MGGYEGIFSEKSSEVENPIVKSQFERTMIV